MRLTGKSEKVLSSAISGWNFASFNSSLPAVRLNLIPYFGVRQMYLANLFSSNNSVQ